MRANSLLAAAWERKSGCTFKTLLPNYIPPASSLVLCRHMAGIQLPPGDDPAGAQTFMYRKLLIRLVMIYYVGKQQPSSCLGKEIRLYNEYVVTVLKTSGL